MSQYKTDQEQLWAGEFGAQYTTRNAIKTSASRVNLFSKVLKNTDGIKTVLEMGANTGAQLMALRQILPEETVYKGLEINPDAFRELEKLDWLEAHQGSLLDGGFVNAADFVFTCAVLIHIPPDYIGRAYEALYNASRRYIFICEYFSRNPVSVTYRGQDNVLFKRDFAGEMMEKYPDLKLVDYGFVSRLDPQFPLDDVNWFLMEKS